MQIGNGRADLRIHAIFFSVIFFGGGGIPSNLHVYNRNDVRNDSRRIRISDISSSRSRQQKYANNAPGKGECFFPRNSPFCHKNRLVSNINTPEIPHSLLAEHLLSSV